MAEFKLGRIRFVYKGTWDNGINYVVDDVVSVGGKTYICVITHTSSSEFVTDQTANPTKWNLVADGTNWLGDWQPETAYQLGDQVQWGGTVYVCNTAHTSATYTSPTFLGLEDDQNSWDAFATTFSWQNAWQATTRYKVRDIVTYGGYTYVCTQHHISQSTLELDSGKWTVFNAGIEYKGEWSGSGVYYKLNDVVKHGADLWICSTAHTSTGTAIDQTKFSIFVNGLQFENSWSNATAYQIGDVVAYGGYTYTCVQNHTNQVPSTSTAYWKPFTTGVNFQGDWISSTSYKIGDLVRLGGYTYIATADNNASKPPSASWARLNSGLKWNPTVGNYSAVGSTNLVSVNGDGNAKFDVVASGTTYTVTVTTGQGGAGYELDDTLTILGSAVGGISPANDITLTVTGQTAGAITTVSVTGISVTWASGVTYVLGDVVFFGANSYICVAAHVASSGNRPDADTAGTSWNLLASGTEQAVLTTQGDMFFYGANGPERLPVGTEGQILRVNNNAPAWAYYGLINNVVYVAPTGEDISGNGTGLTIDKPWKSLQFACQQVAAGYQNLNATSLLARNKQFIIKEVNNYIQYTYPGVCDPVKTERDAGIVLDAIIYDIGHGGTLKTTNAIKEYYNAAGTGYVNSTVSSQITEFVAGQTYLGVVAAAVLNNVAPATNYQLLNSVTTVAEQIIDATVAEDDSKTKLTTLNTLVTSNLAVSNTYNLPPAVQPNTTIYVKTGTYNEVLPIVIPNGTAIVGDELRSTIVQPKAAIPLLVNDKSKTASALNRIKSLIPSVLSNTEIVPTVGNTEVQQSVFTESSITADISSNVSTVVNVVANGVNALPAYVLPTPTSGTNNGSDAGYFNASRLAFANKAFLQAEISAWIDAQILAGTPPFNGFTYAGANRTKCERDIGYIVDALRYDLMYGGNLATVIAARSYYSNGVLVEVGEEAQALAVQTYLKSIIDNIVTGSAIVKTPANAQTQDVSGTPGSAGAATFAQARVQEIYDTIDTGTSPTTIAPDITWPASTKLTANSDILSAKVAIQAESIAWINKTYPNFYYNSTTCSRDLGYIIDALRYDMMFGSNFLSSWNAMSYHRALSSTGVVLTEQLQPTLSVIGYVGANLTSITEGTPTVVGSLVAVETTQKSNALIRDILSNGFSEVPAFIFTEPTGYNVSLVDTAYASTGNATGDTLNYGYGKTQIVQNYTFIKDEIAAYITVNGDYESYTAEYQAKTLRDVGYILDAIQHDITYGGNRQSLIAGRAYYSNNLRQISSTYLTDTLSALSRLKTIIGQVATKTSVTPTAGNTTTQITGGNAGSAGSGTFAQERVQDVIDWINNGVANATVEPYTAWASTGTQNAFAEIQARRDEICSDTVVWIKKFFQATSFNAELAYRDAGDIVDALSYDMVLGSNFNAITAGRRYLSPVTSAQVVVNSLLAETVGSIGFIGWKVRQLAAGGATAQLSVNIDDITNMIDGGAVPRFVWPDYSSIDVQDALAAKLVWKNKAFITAEITAYIDQQIKLGTSGFVGLVYNSAACERDVGYIIDALRYDLTYGGNFATRQAGIAYYSQLTNALQIDGADKSATLAAYAQLKTIVQDIANGGLSSYTPLQTSAGYITGQGGDATSATTAGNLIDGITTTINSGIGSAPAEVLPGTAWVASNLSNANVVLQSARTTIQNSVINYINTNYPSLTYDSATCSRDVGLIVDAIGYDIMFGSNFRSIKAGLSYYQAQASLVLSGQKDATIAAFNFLKTQIEAQLTDSTALSRASANMQLIIDIVKSSAGETPEVHGTLSYRNDLGIIKSAETLRANKDFLAYEATAWVAKTFGGTVTSTTASNNRFTTSASHNLTIGDPVTFTGDPLITGAGVGSGITYYVLTTPTNVTFTLTATQGSSTPVDITSDGTGSMTVTYKFDSAACRRDMRAYIDALIYDLNFTGNYKSLRAAQLYMNAVNGSKTEDMFLVSNGSGLRNCTLTGLLGMLGSENSYGTRRPAAGAYVALNPGFGPNDKDVWVNTRSHYSQNVTMFGTACSGAKIDGALHAGGYRSMVKNDFTTILSDGIGVWCTGSESLVELVSVFNYYGYAGYLAEYGGKIRATNGNSSYGTYGVIAEGVDTYEEPINGFLDNRFFESQIGNVVTDAVNEILRFEYTNAGSHYSNSVVTISGSGYNAAATHDEFRDAAVFETRLIDQNNGQGVGGTGYVTQTNVAQTGLLGSITIAATDTSLSTAYVGMRIQVIAGSGVGQYANILSYNNGTKEALIVKDSFGVLTATATAGTGDLITVSSNAALYADMPIYFSGTTFGNINPNALYYVKALTGSTQFTVYTDTNTKATIDLADGSGSMLVYAAGWDHVIPGKAIVNTLDLTSSYIIEPRISFTSPGYTSTARTLSATATWSAVTYGAGKFVAVASGSTSSSQSADGKTWTNGGALTGTTTAWTDVVYGGGENATATAIIGGLGGSGAVLEAVVGTGTQATQIISVNIINGGYNYNTSPVIEFVGGGGSGATATCRVKNGAITEVTMEINGSGYTVAPAVNVVTSKLTRMVVGAWGKNYNSVPTVTVAAPFSATAWSSGGSATNGTYYSYLGNFYKATGDGTFTTTGPSHTTGSVTNGTVPLLYIGTQATATAILTNGGVSGYTITEEGYGYTSVPTVSIVDSTAKFIAISGTSNASAYQTSAGLASTSAWTALASTGKTNLKSIAYGNGLYIAVGGATGTASCVSSTDPATSWVDRSANITSLSAGNYSSVAYGNGVFVAIQTGGIVTSYCTGNPASWTQGGNLPSSATWSSIAYGNGRFVAIASGGTSVAYSIDKGITWTAAPAGIGSNQTWTKITYGQGLFLAVASGTNVCATSPDGVNWTVRAMPGSATNWKGAAFGNPSSNPVFVGVSNSSGTIAASIQTGAKALGRLKATGGSLVETRMIEPGSGYPKGNVSATVASTDVITTTDTTNLVDLQPVEFVGCASAGLAENVTYYVIGSSIVSNTSFKVANSVVNAGLGNAVALTDASGLTGTYRAGPIATQFDPNKVNTAGTRVRLGDGALGNPSFGNRGVNNATATATTLGDGYGDLYQSSSFVNVYGLYSIPNAGANVQFDSITGGNQWYKLVAVTNVLAAADGTFTAQFQINPALTPLLAPAHGDAITTKLKYSQVRLTGHDYLYIGVGNQSATNYPNVNPANAIQANQELMVGGGRVFFTSTDQDGNFNVGDLFGVQQATGTATLNASAFNLAGLQSLQLGAVSLGVGSAVITQFSTDPYFTANSDNVVPTQKAIKAFITAQIGGGSSSLNVNTITSGQIYIAGNTISNTTGGEIKVTSKMNFVGGIDGAPVALAYFGQR